MRSPRRRHTPTPRRPWRKPGSSRTSFHPDGLPSAIPCRAAPPRGRSGCCPSSARTLQTSWVRSEYRMSVETASSSPPRYQVGPAQWYAELVPDELQAGAHRLLETRRLVGGGGGPAEQLDQRVVPPQRLVGPLAVGLVAGDGGGARTRHRGPVSGTWSEIRRRAGRPWRASSSRSRPRIPRALPWTAGPAPRPGCSDGSSRRWACPTAPAAVYP